MSRVEHHLPGDLDAPARSRRLTEEFLDRLPGDAGRDSDLVLAVSELVANGVLHGADTAVAGIVLTLEHDGRQVRAGVEHDGSTFDPSVDRPFHGLGMVGQIVDRWGIDADGGRVTVWFEADRTADRVAGGSPGDGRR